MSQVTEPLPSAATSAAAESATQPVGLPGEDRTLMHVGDRGPERRSWLMSVAGVDPTWVHVRSERLLYTSAGVILLAYTVYAYVGVWAFATMATSSAVLALAAAAVLGSVIVAINLSIDRGLIGYIPADLSGIRDVEKDSAPLLDSRSVRWSRRLRVLLAILFALAVGEPANLFLFGKDVEAAMVARDYTVMERQRTRDTLVYADQVRAAQTALATAKAERDRILAYPDQLLARAEAERKGQGATGTPGCGPECQSFIQQARQARAQVPAAVAEQEARIAAATTTLQQINDTKNKNAADAGGFSQANNGFLAREEAFYTTLFREPMLAFRYLIIVLVFLCLEMGAVLTKYLAKGNHYERQTARRTRLAEYASIVDAEHERRTIAHRADLTRRLRADRDEHAYAVESARFPRRVTTP